MRKTIQKFLLADAIIFHPFLNQFYNVWESLFHSQYVRTSQYQQLGYFYKRNKTTPSLELEQLNRKKLFRQSKTVEIKIIHIENILVLLIGRGQNFQIFKQIKYICKIPRFLRCNGDESWTDQVCLQYILGLYGQF